MIQSKQSATATTLRLLSNPATLVLVKRLRAAGVCVLVPEELCAQVGNAMFFDEQEGVHFEAVKKTVAEMPLMDDAVAEALKRIEDDEFFGFKTEAVAA
jgi:hypothetical protein